MESGKNRLVVHLHFLENDEHHYLGSIGAMYDYFTTEQLGVAKQTLYNYAWKNNIYQNNKVIIRKGRLVQKSHSKK